MGRGARFVSLLTAAALLAAVSIPVASGSSDSPAAAAKKKCKGKALAAKKGKCKKKKPARTPASLSISPPSYDFGVTPVPQTQGTRFIVTNKGGSPSGVPSVVLTDSSTPPGAMTINQNGCTQPIVSTCAISVNYNSSVVGLQGRATLTVTAAPGGSVSATIVGST